MQGVILDADSFDHGDLDFTRLRASLPAWRVHRETRSGGLAARLQAAEVVVANKVMLDAAALAQAEQLQLVCIAATGANNIDLDAARARGIQVCNVTGYATPSVVQHVFMLILVLLRRLPDYSAALRRGDWQRSRQFCLLDYPIEELQDQTLGIVGYGELGQAVARLAQALGMRVLIARRDADDRRDQRLPLDELLQQVDILSLHCPLTESTRKLIGRRELALMKPGAVLINTARGGIVDEAALYTALQTGQIAGAGLDVLEQEPPAADAVLLQAALPNLVITPHIAWASRAARQRLLDQVAENILSYTQGRLRNRIV